MSAGSERKYDQAPISSSKSELIVGQYRVYLNIEESQLLTIEAEHRQTKQVYKTEKVDNKQVESLTSGFCQTVNDLFHVAQDVLAQSITTSPNCSSNEQQITKSYTIEEKENTLELHFHISIGLGKWSARNWSFIIGLKKVEMDDVARHERVIADLCRRIERLEERLVPPLDYIRSLSDVKFCVSTSPYPTFNLSNNNKTCTAIQNPNAGIGGELSVDQTFASTTNDDILKITFKCTAGSTQTVRVGVKVNMTSNSHTVSSASSKDAWFFYLQTGCCQNGSYTQMPCQCPVMLNQTISIVVDLKKKKVAFVIDGDTDIWAFKMPKETDMTQLRAFIVVHGNGDTITIVEE